MSPKSDSPLTSVAIEVVQVRIHLLTTNKTLLIWRRNTISFFIRVIDVQIPRVNSLTLQIHHPALEPLLVVRISFTVGYEGSTIVANCLLVRR